MNDACDDNVAVASDEQSSNILYPADVTVFGIIILVNPEFWNTTLLIVVIFDGIVILVNAEQFIKVLLSNVVNDACDDNVTDAIEEQSSNALYPTDVTVFGIVILVNPEFLNAVLLIVVIFDGIVILVNAEQFVKILFSNVVNDACDDNVAVASEEQSWNTLYPTVVTVFGNIILVNPEFLNVL